MRVIIQYMFPFAIVLGVCCGVYLFLFFKDPQIVTPEQRTDQGLEEWDRKLLYDVQSIIGLYEQNDRGFRLWSTISEMFVSRKKSHNLQIIVIVFNRHKSLLRLLNSLNEAEYYNEDIKMDIWIDRSKTGIEDEQTLTCAENFNFRHGEKSVHVHLKHVGIYGQWLATLNIKDDGKEIAVILEDDLTVSKYFYKYLKMVHARYDKYPYINGYALQGVSMKHGLPQKTGWLSGPDNHSVFLYPVIGTWGFSPSPANWEAFIKWIMNVFKDKHFFVPSIPGNVASVWYGRSRNEKKNDRIWSMWHIYYTWCKKEYTLYPNIDDHMGLTANWMEPGLHYVGKSQQPSNKLVTEWHADYERLPSIPMRLNLYGEPEEKDANNRNYSTCTEGFP